MKPVILPRTPAVGTLLRWENFPSRHIQPRHVDIWLPPGYSAASESRCPVIYMQDGQNLFLPETSTLGIPWGVDKAISGLMQAGRIQPAIVVGVWNIKEDRWREYAPQKPVESPPGRAFLAQNFSDKLNGPVISDHYLKFLVDELKPFIDATYCTHSEQPSTFMMGSSMGALLSLYALTEYPHIFGGAGCLSTHWTAGENLMADYFGSVLPKAGAHKLYFDFGTQTLDAAYEPFQRRMDEHLRSAGYTQKDWLTCKFDGHEHSERSWSERVHIPLEFLLSGKTFSQEVQA